MSLSLPFRLLSYALVTTLGLITASNLLVDILKPPGGLVFNNRSPYAKIDQACLSYTFSFERSDLNVNCALARSMLALSTVDPGAHNLNEQAHATVIKTLASSPHESRVWLALALLQSQANEPNGDALKMSYLTAPNTAELIPMRLASAVANNALSDPDLRTLAAGDMRLILTHRREMIGAIVDAYKQASKTGKAFIEEKTRTLDPKFLESLQPSN
jgi:hypothetical protein